MNQPIYPTEALITESIILLRERWLQKRSVKRIWEINDGYCYGFAEEVMFDILCHEKGVSNEFILGDSGKIGDMNKVFYLSNEHFQNITLDEKGNEIPLFVDKYKIKYFPWNVELLEKFNIKPPQGLTWEKANYVPFGYHVFIVFNNRFYDAECPEGVDNFFDLPIYKLTLEKYSSIDLEC